MLSEINQTKEDKYCMMSPIYGIFKKQKCKRKIRVKWQLPGDGGWRGQDGYLSIQTGKV